MRILILNGPNLNLLGKRDNQHYGDLSLDKLQEILIKEFPKHKFTFFQSNIEGELIDRIQKSAEEFDALIINPGGYAHSSVAIRDALVEGTLQSSEYTPITATKNIKLSQKGRCDKCTIC